MSDPTWLQWKRPGAPWHELLAALPTDARVQRGPLAAADVLPAPDNPIEGWEQLAINLTAPGVGLRHVLVVLDGAGRPVSVGDAVLYSATVTAAEARASADLHAGETVFYHENIGGRLEADGSFRGTRWHAFSVQRGPADDMPIHSSKPSAPTDAEVAGLRVLLAEVLRLAAISGN